MITNYTVSAELVDARSQNVKDIYKGWVAEEVRADLVKNRSNMVSVFMNLTNDFNKSTAIRANNAFLGDSVYLVGKRRYDKRGTVGTFNYETIYHADTFDDVYEALKTDGYTIYAVDNIDSYNPKNLWDVEFPEKSAFVYGEEQLGLSDEVISKCDDMIFINTPGSVRSLNVACAATAIMSEYSRQMYKKSV